MKKLIIVPTLNEKKNILNLYKKINKTNINFDILFVDDNSIDGSQEIIKKLAKKSEKVKYLTTRVPKIQTKIVQKIRVP